MTSTRPFTENDRAWWSTSRRRVFYDAHTPDFADRHQLGLVPDPTFPVLSAVDPEGDLQTMADAAVDSVVLFAKCQYGNAYYPTAVGHAHSALDGRDLFGAQLAAAHRRGIRVIAYFSNMWDTHAAGAHPEWRLVPLDARGATGRWPALCLRSGYREYAIAQAVEIAERYPVDGFWSDILTAGPCVCASCAAEFRRRTGHDVPTDRGDATWVDLVRFSGDVLDEYLAEQSAALRAVRPEIAFIPNFYGTTFVDAILGLRADHLRLADIGSSEGYTDWHGLGFPSFAAGYVQNAALGKPTEVLVSRFVHTWDSSIRSEAQLRYEAFTVAARGSAVSLDDQPRADGGMEHEVYARLAPAFRRIREREPWLVGAVPERFAAVYTSQSARELESRLGASENPSDGEQSAQFPPSEPRTSRSDLAASVTGAYRALVESHVPVGFVDERPESLAALADSRVLVLADVLHLDDAEVEAIEEFVLAGGGLVVLGECGVLDGRGDPRVHPRMREMLGVEFADRWGGAHYPFVRPVGELAEIVGPQAVPHYGRIPRLELRGEATVLAELTLPVLETASDSYWHNNQPAPGRDLAVPVIVEVSRGLGRVIVSSARLGGNHARLGHAQYRAMIEALVLRAAGGRPPVVVHGGRRSTELALARLGDDLIVHLVTGSPVPRLDVFGSPQPASVEDVAQLAELSFTVPASTTSASRIVDGVEVGIEIADGVVSLPLADDWETVVLHGAARS